MIKCYLLLTRQTEKPFSLQGCEKLFLTKAIETGIILLCGDIKKYFYVFLRQLQA